MSGLSIRYFPHLHFPSRASTIGHIIDTPRHARSDPDPVSLNLTPSRTQQSFCLIDADNSLSIDMDEFFDFFELRESVRDDGGRVCV